MKTSLEIWFGQTLRKKSLWFQTFTYLPSLLFKFVVKVRHFLYDCGMKKQSRLSIPIVSIGNIVAGGTGKTPVTQYLAQELLKRYCVAILSRGYRSEAEKGKHSIVVDVGRHSPHECGDEPWLLASNLPRAIVISGKKRIKGATLALKNGVEVILLDDGMQHRALHRDLEIVVLNGEDPFGKNAFLPQGLLREDPRRLSHADLILIAGDCSLEVRKDIKKLSEAPIASFINKPMGIFSLKGEPITFKGTQVGLFCAIANPERFVKSVEGMGLEVVSTYFLSDHAKLEDSELKAYTSDAIKKGAQLLLCTEKDKVKLSRSFDSDLLIGWIKSEIVIHENQEAWQEIVERINQLIGKKA